MTFNGIGKKFLGEGKITCHTKCTDKLIQAFIKGHVNIYLLLIIFTD